MRELTEEERAELAVGAPWLRSRNLSETNLWGVNLRSAELGSADLHGADLGRACLHGAGLRAADLHDANLSGADLCCAVLSQANLCRATLIGANLCDAHLREAHLHEADLAEVNLLGADLTSAELCGARLPAPQTVLTAEWDVVSDDLCVELMRYDAASHPKGGRVFSAWAKGGPCPYANARWARAANFEQRAELWSPGPAKSALWLAERVLDEKCPGWRDTTA